MKGTKKKGYIVLVNQSRKFRNNRKVNSGIGEFPKGLFFEFE